MMAERLSAGRLSVAAFDMMVGVEENYREVWASSMDANCDEKQVYIR